MVRSSGRAAAAAVRHGIGLISLEYTYRRLLLSLLFPQI